MIFFFANGAGERFRFSFCISLVLHAPRQSGSARPRGGSCEQGVTLGAGARGGSGKAAGRCGRAISCCFYQTDRTVGVRASLRLDTPDHERGVCGSPDEKGGRGEGTCFTTLWFMIGRLVVISGPVKSTPPSLASCGGLGDGMVDSTTCAGVSRTRTAGSESEGGTGENPGAAAEGPLPADRLPRGRGCAESEQ